MAIYSGDPQYDAYVRERDKDEEIKRLRAALREIADHAPVKYVGENKVDYACQRIARATLDEQIAGIEKWAGLHAAAERVHARPCDGSSVHDARRANRRLRTG